MKSIEGSGAQMKSGAQIGGRGAGMAAALRALARGSDRYEGPGRAGEDRRSDRTEVVALHFGPTQMGGLSVEQRFPQMERTSVLRDSSEFHRACGLTMSRLGLSSTRKRTREHSLAYCEQLTQPARRIRVGE